VDLAKETAATRTAFGLDDPRTADFGTRCLLARRLVERGVRFVQLYSGGGPLVTQWDAHDDLNANHEKMCGHVDRPIAALLKDLKQRGLLDSTLVVWASATRPSSTCSAWSTRNSPSCTTAARSV
jgi:hypothetical protein